MPDTGRNGAYISAINKHTQSVVDYNFSTVAMACNSQPPSSSSTCTSLEKKSLYLEPFNLSSHFPSVQLCSYVVLSSHYCWLQQILSRCFLVIMLGIFPLLLDLKPRVASRIISEFCSLRPALL